LPLATVRLPLGSAVTEKSRIAWYFSSGLAPDLGVVRFAGLFADFFLAAMAFPLET
jgi:hypothetical protein